MKSSNGLTLIELMVTLAVLSILIAVAAPNFQNVTASNKLTIELNAFSDAFATAASESGTRGSRAYVAVGDATVSGTVPTGGSTWQAAGWQVVAFDPVANALIPIKSRPGIPATSTLSVTATPVGTTLITYNPDGTLANGAVNFLFCDSTSPGRGKSINIGINQRASLNSNDTTCP